MSKPAPTFETTATTAARCALLQIAAGTGAPPTARVAGAKLLLAGEPARPESKSRARPPKARAAGQRTTGETRSLSRLHAGLHGDA
jgi:hypothetical protein